MDAKTKALWVCRILVPVGWAFMPLIWVLGVARLVGVGVFELCCLAEDKHNMLRVARRLLAVDACSERDRSRGVR